MAADLLLDIADGQAINVTRAHRLALSATARDELGGLAHAVLSAIDEFIIRRCTELAAPLPACIADAPAVTPGPGSRKT